MYISVSKTEHSVSASYYACYVIICISKTWRQDIFLSLALLLWKDLIRKAEGFFSKLYLFSLKTLPQSTL